MNSVFMYYSLQIYLIIFGLTEVTFWSIVWKMYIVHTTQISCILKINGFFPLHFTKLGVNLELENLEYVHCLYHIFVGKRAKYIKV